MATDRQIAANKRNASRSTGPKTAAGKVASRINATKHGLTAGSPELEASRSPAFESRRLAWASTYRVNGEVDSWALDRAVAASFRIERCEQAIDALARTTKRRASLNWDQHQALIAAKLGSRLAKNPSRIARTLQTSKQGVDLMIDWWNRLEAPLRAGKAWSEAEANTALDLLGVPTDLRSGQTPIDPFPGTTPLKFRRELVRREVDRLRSLRDDALKQLDQLDREQAVAGESALLDHDARLVLRYERDAWRHYQDALKTLSSEDQKPRPIVIAEPVAVPVPKPVPGVNLPTARPRPSPEPPQPLEVEVEFDFEDEDEADMDDDAFDDAMMARARLGMGQVSPEVFRSFAMGPEVDAFLANHADDETNPIGQTAQLLRRLRTTDFQGSSDSNVSRQ